MNKLHIGRMPTIVMLSFLSVSITASITAHAGITTRVNVDSEGRGGSGDPHPEARIAINADGRYVAFHSGASNLVPLDTNAVSDIFLYDRQIGTTTRLSVDSAGGQANSYSFSPAFSADGRYVAFMSYASNLVPGDTNDTTDIFVHDRQTGTTIRVSVNSAGGQGEGEGSYGFGSYAPALSADGRYAAFTSFASNLVPGDTNYTSDIFVHDRQTGTTTRVSIDSTGAQGNYNSHSDSLALSTDGRYVAFVSFASNLVPGDTDDTSDIFVHDRQTGTTTRVSVDSAGGQGNNGSFAPALSADGRYVVFHSEASNLVPSDTNGTGDIFVHDRQTGITSRVSVDSVGGQGNNGSFAPALSADGRNVAFSSFATNLVPDDTNVAYDMFVYDRQAGTTSRVNVDSAGRQSDGVSRSYATFLPALSADGRYVAFQSDASNLVPNDINNAHDIFVHDRVGVLLEGPTGAATCSDGLDNDSDG